MGGFLFQSSPFGVFELGQRFLARRICCVWVKF